MASSIQLLRSTSASERPFPGNLLDGQPAINLNSAEPGLYFKVTDGTLHKVGSVPIGPVPPNSAPLGAVGNSLGEFWLDTSGISPDLKYFDGTSFTSVVTPPSVPDLPASKITSGIFDPDRIPLLDTTKIGSGAFLPDRIPGLPASKIVSGTLSISVGGTGISAVPDPGELLIGNGTNWSKSLLTAGNNIQITNGPGSITIGTSSTPSLNELIVFDSADTNSITISAPTINNSYLLRLPTDDGVTGSVLSTNGSGQLSFVTSLTGITSITGPSPITISAGGFNSNVTLAPTGSGVVSMSEARVSDVANPIVSSDAATKSYVDSIAGGIKPKTQVTAASTNDINLIAGGLFSIDGVPISSGSRVLVKDQILPRENGIYIAASGSWTRAADADTFQELSNAIVFAANGVNNKGKTFLCTVQAGGTIGIDPNTWSVFSSDQGSVTSVRLIMPPGFLVNNSPITRSGTFNVTYNEQLANKIFAGPTHGAQTAPSFRSLVAADLPTNLGSHTFTGAVSFQNAVSLGNDPSDNVLFGGTVTTNIIPAPGLNLGSPTDRWANLYTGDLHLTNEGDTNEIDGTWGSYSVQEGENALYLINRRDGKRYKFVLEEV